MPGISGVRSFVYRAQGRGNHSGLAPTPGDAAPSSHPGSTDSQRGWSAGAWHSGGSRVRGGRGWLTQVAGRRGLLSLPPALTTSSLCWVNCGRRPLGRGRGEHLSRLYTCSSCCPGSPSSGISEPCPLMGRGVVPLLTVREGCQSQYACPGLLQDWFSSPILQAGFKSAFQIQGPAVHTEL